MDRRADAVEEELRISFTKQLLRLREENLNEITFSNQLTNIERKFLHKLAGELGLVSHSHGKGEDRKITVTKRAGNNELSVDKEDEIPVVQFSKTTTKLLKTQFHVVDPSVMATLNTTEVSRSFAFDVSNKPNAAEQDKRVIMSSYERAQRDRLAHPNYSKVQESRSSLPAFEHAANVCKLIEENQIVLVSGETGCGKTTQVPQFLLDDPKIGSTCRIVVTQPRRISAISVAERIAKERTEEIGKTIGYNIRMESEKSKSTQVLFVTPGVLLRKLITDPLLEEFTHVIIDEAHERDRHTEFLLIILRDICSKRQKLKLVLMSATLHTNKISSYFGGCPHIHIGGSVFPVQEYFLEHVLRFTEYMKSSANDGASVIANTATGALSQLSQAYTCSICQSGPFKTPGELGSHSAFCFTSNGPSKGKNTNYYKHTNINELARVLYGAAKAPTTSPRAKLIASYSERMEKEAVKDALDEDSDPGSSDDEDGAASLKTSTIAADMRTISVEDSSAELLLSQYHSQFDDSQVDYDLIMALLLYIFKSSEFCQQGSVLIFLPGWDDINKLYRLLQATGEFNDQKYKIFQLHSGIAKKEQSMVFEPLNEGEHKIILSTNIAETSITIDDVVVVIDSGRQKEKTYDPHVKLDYLKATWVSQAAARQRKGRAGRTRSGVCFHLFSAKRHKSLAEHQDSELLRMPLEELVLQAKHLGLAPGMGNAHDSIQSFLAKALDPPHELSVANAVALLKSINCLDSNENVTPIGAAISRLPVDPRIGRLILIGSLLGVAPAIVTVAAAMGYRDPFVMPMNDQQKKLCDKVKSMLSNGMPSDQLLLYKAVEGFKSAFSNHSNVGKSYQYCDEHFLSRSTMMYLVDLTKQLTFLMEDIGIVTSRAYNQRNNGNNNLLMSIVGVGLYPDIAVRVAGSSLFHTEKKIKCRIHPSSINFKTPLYKTECKNAIEAVGYQDLVSINTANGGFSNANIAMLGSNPVSIFSLLMTSGKITEKKVLGNSQVLVEIDEWLHVKFDVDIYRCIVNARNCLTAAMFVYINAPDTFNSSPLSFSVEAIVNALAAEQPQVTSAATNSASNGGSNKNPHAAVGASMGKSKYKH